MQLTPQTPLWYVDTDGPSCGRVTLGSVYQGIAESYLYGPTGYMTGRVEVFTERAEALARFHELWPDREMVEAHLRECYGERADAMIEALYGA